MDRDRLAQLFDATKDAAGHLRSVDVSERLTEHIDAKMLEMARQIGDTSTGEFFESVSEEYLRHEPRPDAVDHHNAYLHPNPISTADQLADPRHRRCDAGRPGAGHHRPVRRVRPAGEAVRARAAGGQVPLPEQPPGPARPGVHARVLPQGGPRVHAASTGSSTTSRSWSAGCSATTRWAGSTSSTGSSARPAACSRPSRSAGPRSSTSRASARTTSIRCCGCSARSATTRPSTSSSS